ncbi:hypothetical protein KY290_007167 [Solanum tuberosum]|uniref:Uncharacterized protein n=1 Tax=Solanum tuberosum TaxID=4113 RepID=A0ABQ7W659_SOLTU|nr:hypothetical protein KY290_007167 [Solanum tuberosum]
MALPRLRHPLIFRAPSLLRARRLLAAGPSNSSTLRSLHQYAFLFTFFFCHFLNRRNSLTQNPVIDSTGCNRNY